MSFSQPEQRLACSMLLLEAEQWPPLPESYPSQEVIQKRVEMMNNADDAWIETYKAELRAKLARSDVRVELIRRYLLHHGIAL